jgi:Domain of unknown function (DUF5666)
MKLLAALLLLATLVSCAGPTPEPIDEAAVVEPGVVCRVGHNGGPVVTERGIGGTGAPAKTQLSDRGIGGTGIVGVVTGFASICVDGLEVRLDKTVSVSINGSAATTRQLRVGQLVVIKASGPVTASDSVAQAQTVSVRYEVSGPIEAIDTSSGAMMVAGQRVMALPSTWVAGRFGPGDWIIVSGLRRSDGTIMASRLDRARVGALAVRGQVSREHDTTRIGSLALHGPTVATLRAGMFISVAGRYQNGAAEVTAMDEDRLFEDPAGYFGISTGQLIVQAFVQVERGMVWLNNGQRFKAGPDVQGKGGLYRNAIVWLERRTDGSFIVTGLHYTNYRAQPKDAPSRARGHGGGGLILPPDAPPEPPTDAAPASATDGENDVDGATGPASYPPPGDTPISNVAPSQAGPFADRAFIAHQVPKVRIAARH